MPFTKSRAPLGACGISESLAARVPVNGEVALEKLAQTTTPESRVALKIMVKFNKILPAFVKFKMGLPLDASWQVFGSGIPEVTPVQGSMYLASRTLALNHKSLVLFPGKVVIDTFSLAALGVPTRNFELVPAAETISRA